ncbi:MAG TPA: tripartite tricarboxylate transporter substrate-binding protein [Xanthobacteraceae bacterium]|nr:tripartite tricarboxylate transporter substrate-binding protein [Xanthobacteraceae bacterium]
MKTRTLLPLIAIALVAACGAASAQVYPSRPITMVVPLAPGGPLDTIARILAEPMRTFLGQPVIVENVTGAAGTIGTGRVARATPDGYTFGMGFLGTLVLNGAIYTLPYDVVTDLEPIALISSNPHMIVANASLPAKNLREFIAWLKLHPDKASAGTAGAGTSTHLGGLLFQQSAGVRFQLVPYRGAAPALQDVMAGQIDLMIDVASNSLPHLRGGKIKAYAVTASTRLASAPDIPTVDEAGLPGFHMSTWYGLFGPKAMPRDVLAKLNAATVSALADPTVGRRFADLGLDTTPREQQTPEALAALQRAEIEKWWPIIKAANIKPE